MYATKYCYVKRSPKLKEKLVCRKSILKTDKIMLIIID